MADLKMAAGSAPNAEHQRRTSTPELPSVQSEQPTLLSLSRLGSPTSVGALCVDSQVNLAFVLQPLVQSVLSGIDFYGVKSEKAGKVVVLTSQDLTYFMLRDSFSGDDFQKSLKLVSPALTGGTDWLLPEGRALLEKSAGVNCELMVATVAVRSRKAPLAFDHLPALIASMRLKSRAAILAFHGLSSDDAKQLPNYFGLVLNVKDCEPDRDFTSAYLVQPAAGTFLAGVNVSPYLENVRLADDGSVARKSYPSHASDPMTREIVKMREKGRTLASIGEEFGVDRATVLRRLQKLPYGHRYDRD